MNATVEVFYVILFILSAVGIICNVICCSYFMTTKNRNGLSNNLIMVLCGFDFIVCVTYPVNRYFHKHIFCDLSSYISIADLVNTAVMTVGFTMTGIITTTLTVLRSLLILRPLYLVRTKVVYGYLLIATALSSVTATTCLVSTNLTEGLFGPISALGTYGVEIIICVASAVPAIYTLRKRQLQVTKPQLQDVQLQRNVQNQYKASVTIMVLTAAFIVSNMTAWSSMLFSFLICLEDTSSEWVVYSQYLKASILVNSVCNPLIIITRKQELRLYAKQKFRRVSTC